MNSVLQEIGLSDNEIGVEGARYIAEALKINYVLQALYFSYNGIGVEGARAICWCVKDSFCSAND
jgi:hypothetical protein